PRDEWRPGMTPERLLEELDRAAQAPRLAKVRVPPIRSRIGMLAPGSKRPLGVAVSGPSAQPIEQVAQAVEAQARQVPGVTSALAERLVGGAYLDVQIDRRAAARFGLNIADVQALVAGVVGGRTIGEVVEGQARFPISLRYPRAW